MTPIEQAQLLMLAIQFIEGQIAMLKAAHGLSDADMAAAKSATAANHERYQKFLAAAGRS